MQFHEPSWISLEPGNYIVFDTLLSFIDSASSDPANVQDLADSTITALLRATGTPSPSVDQYRFESQQLFGILFTVVQQLDAAAAQQDYLIKLVLSFRHVPLPPRVAQEVDPQAMDLNMNEELYYLVHVWSNFERDAPLHPLLEDRPNCPQAPPERAPWRQESGQRLTGRAWANLNAFMARLHAVAPDVTRLDLRGLFAMIEALEQPLTASQLDDLLPAAACWIVYARDELQRNNIPYPYSADDGSRRLPWSKGQLWTGQHAFNRPRWEFWLQRFKAVAERGDVSDTVRSAAWHALEAGS